MRRRTHKSNKPFARKRFGQHFLIDQSIINQIIASADVRHEDHIIEIGPGRGALTKPLVEQGAELTVVELDRDLAENLRQEYRNESNIRIVEGDILKTDWISIFKKGKNNKIIANLPYNISSPIFFRMVEHRKLLDLVVIMVQKELAQRIQHDGKGKKLKDYGILSVVAGNTFKVNTVCQVPPSSFAPPPRVDSTVIRMVPEDIDLTNEEAFFGFVKKAFNNRRKLFTSFLQREYPAIHESLSDKGHEYFRGLRPENLLPQQYLQLFQGIFPAD